MNEEHRRVKVKLNMRRELIVKKFWRKSHEALGAADVEFQVKSTELAASCLELFSTSN